MSYFREIESRYNPVKLQGPVVTHITSVDTFEAINQTHFPAFCHPTLLAVRQSRTISGPNGVNVSCNLGPFIYTFNHPAKHFVSGAGGALTMKGIQAKAGTDKLVLIELDISEQENEVVEVPRFLPLQVETAYRIIALLNQSEIGRLLLQEFINVINLMRPEQIDRMNEMQNLLVKQGYMVPNKRM